MTPPSNNNRSIAHFLPEWVKEFSGLENCFSVARIRLFINDPIFLFIVGYFRRWKPAKSINSQQAAHQLTGSII